MEMIGIGTDIVEVDRICKACKDEKFITRYFTKDEIEMFNLCKCKKENTIAGRFAAKEAIVKALGIGFSGISPIQIEVLREKSGKPIAKIVNKKFQDLKIDISISHTDSNAIAFAIVTKGD